jgi:hypothetical protein
MRDSSSITPKLWYRSYACSIRFLAVRLFLTLPCLACDILPQPGDTNGVQQQAQWFTAGRLVVDTDPNLTLVRVRAEPLDSAQGGHDVMVTRFDFDPTPGIGDEYAITLGLDLGDVHTLERGVPYALGPPPARIPAYGTVTCLCQPLAPDSVLGTFTISQRGFAQIVGRIDATLFFTAWADTTRHTTYRLRQRIDGLIS